jgi:aminoglycoside phosphotransferase (APT) family kinase protein
MTDVERGRASTGSIEAGLLEYYRRRHPEREGVVIFEFEEITMGWETELYSFNVRFRCDGREIEEGRVVRLYQGDHASRKAAQEFGVMSRLLDCGYPVPEVYLLETEAGILGKPFVIMERVEGVNMDVAIREGSEKDLQQMLGLLVGLFVDLHRLDVSPVFPGREDTTTLSYIEGMLRWSGERAGRSGIGWLDPVISWLDERKANVFPVEPSVIHRDFHPMNVMLREDGSPAVIDWSAATVGDYRDDLAWTVLLAVTFWDPSLRDTILGAYESISGREIRGFEYFEVLSTLRRLTDVAVSLTSGAEEMGMRAGAVEMMREASDHIHKVYELLKERTGLRLPEFEELLRTL